MNSPRPEEITWPVSGNRFGFWKGGRLLKTFGAEGIPPPVFRTSFQNWLSTIITWLASKRFISCP